MKARVVTLPPYEATPDRMAVFVSDMHLGASYMPDRREHERRVCNMLSEVAPRCGRLFIVGDALDYWYEYRTVVPRGFVRFFGQLAAMADAGTEIVWLIGNHDIWLFDYLRNEIGMQVIDGSVVTEMNGRQFFISHGDGLGERPWTFRALRAMFRNRVCQWLYAGVHPRWTVGMAHGWSAGSRGSYAEAEHPFEGDMERRVMQWADGYVAEHPTTDWIVLGHHHVVVDRQVGDHTRLAILGDWITHDSWAEFDGQKLEFKHYAKR